VADSGNVSLEVIKDLPCSVLKFDFARSQKILKDPEDPENPEDPERYQKMPKDTERSQRFPKYPERSQNIPRDLM